MAGFKERFWRSEGRLCSRKQPSRPAFIKSGYLTSINVEAAIGCNRVSGFHELTPRQPKVIQTI
jgi:hypothetical protein